MAETKPNYLDPQILNKVGRLELRARYVVEGFVSGMHQSPYKGSAVEFAQHREYVQGDDIRYIDWKIYGKTDRIYIKEFEEETNLRAHLFVDRSESMAYGHDDGMNKFDYAATACASLAFMIQQQADAVGLNLFAEELITSIPPSNTRGNLGNILGALEGATPNDGTKIGETLQKLAARLPQRGMVMVFSDLFDEADSVLAGLAARGRRGHDVVVFHTLDRDEIEFPFERMTMFEGLESMPDLLADPRGLREAYLQEIGAFNEKIRKGCLAQRIDYVRLETNQPLDVVLSSFLAARAARNKARK